MYYFGSPFGMSGYDEYSFTVGKNEVLFVGAYQFGESSLEISTSGAANVGTYDEITKKYCITEILNYVKATSWRTRLEEEFANLN
jgi:hypothetical protein